MEAETLDTEIEFTSSAAAPKPQRETTKTKPTKKILYGGIPTNPTDIGLQLFAHDPKKYATFGKHMLGKEIKNDQIKFQFTNKKYLHMENKIKALLDAGSIEITAEMIQQRHNLKEIGDECCEILTPVNKSSK